MGSNRCDIRSLAAVREADAICFGSLAQRSAISRQSICQLLSAAKVDALRVFDVNLRQHYYDREILERSLKLANVLKVNEEELPVIAGLFELPNDPHQQMQDLAGAFGLYTVVLTCGSRGSVILQAGRWSEQKPKIGKVVDTVGAGDAFTAALALGVLHGEDLDAVHAFASEVAGWVCGCAGGTPALPEKFQHHFDSLRPAGPCAN